MNFKYKLRRFINRLDLPGLMTYLVITMAIILVGDMASGYMISQTFGFYRSAVLSGQVWRIITFMALPTNYSPVWAVISLMFYYGIGRDLEMAWGSRNVTHYLLLGTVFTVIAGFISGYTENTYLLMSLFFAYAMIMPDNIFMIFFVIPCKAKWLAIADAVFMAVSFIVGAGRWSIIAAVAVFTVFFGGDFIRPLINKWKHRDFFREMRRSRIKVQKGGKNGGHGGLGERER